MNVYKVYRNSKADIGYDQSAAFVVIAESTDRARAVCSLLEYSTHASRMGDGHYGGTKWCYECDDYWEDLENPEVTVMALAYDTHLRDEEVVAHEYRAG